MRHSGLWLLLLLTLVFTPFLSAQPVPCEAAGQTLRETYSSARLGQTMFYTVHLPPCYDPERTQSYPVVYLMHGSNEDDRQWARIGLLDVLDAAVISGQIEPLVLVMPFGNVIANRNRFDRASWGAIFMDELLPAVESRHHLRTDGAGRAIGGISRGGFWAFHLAFKYPEQFARVAGHSPFFDLYHAPPEENPLDLAIHSTGIDRLAIWLDHGADDYAIDGIEILDRRLTERGIDHRYIVNPEGEHNNAYWSQHVDDYLDFYAAITQPAVNTPAAIPLSAFATNTPAAPQPSPTAPAPTGASASEMLFPVVAFPALQTTVSSTTLTAFVAGEWLPNLILDTETVALLSQQGIVPHPETRIVAPDELRDALWRDRDAFSLLPLERIPLDLRVIFVDDQPVTEQLTSYPLTWGAAPQLTRLTLSGVTALARQTRVALNEQGIVWATEALAPYTQAADLFHISSEVSFVPGCPQSSAELLGGASSFCANPDHAGLFDLLGTDIIELSGNHNNDYGYDAYRATLERLQTSGFLTVGGGLDVSSARQPLILETQGGRIGWLACNAVGPYYALANDDPALLGGIRPGAAACDWTWLANAVPDLAAQVDVVIVTVQYQEVEDYQPLPQQRIDFRRLADLGADVVLGTQAHKPQTYEFYPIDGQRTAFLHYGMGNLYFDQPFWGNSRFFLNTLYLSDGQLRAVEIFPGIIEDFARPRLMTADERENFLFFMFREQNGF